ncbi:MAG: hypothetical protein KA766_01360 [Piscinibacter sp.]|uniref:hypothetical protein n=1 Tax=Piscinibacter sp. TaxID=1903157 RepID=UPI001B7CB98A|nr:hypothetical protein [Piscinibacter sp.]MBP5988648.1 hypothetical protein [Piscinibacter sp.]MBP6025863.1 hypothetical protein [Piscinibacter sp.]
MTQKVEAKSGPGRPEELTEELAKRIAIMIGHMPLAGVPVTWDNIVLHVEKKFGRRFHRNIMSQKSWGGVKLIANAYAAAGGVAKRLKTQAAPKYATQSRAFLQRRITELEATIMELSEQLEATRAKQYEEFALLLDCRTPLHQLVELKAKAREQ